jgi:hypothetical protein
MNTFEKNMEEVFDLVPVKEPNREKLPTVSTRYNEPDLKQDLTDAYQQSKENLQGIIDQGQEAMEEILEIAKQSQHPRAFEVFGGILKNVVDANKELLTIQKQMREMDGKKETNNTTIDKAIFVGSTAELSKLLKGNNERQLS